MRAPEIVEAVGIFLLLAGFAAMVYALWLVRGPAAWFGVGGLLMAIAVLMIATANRGAE